MWLQTQSNIHPNLHCPRQRPNLHYYLLISSTNVWMSCYDLRDADFCPILIWNGCLTLKCRMDGVFCALEGNIITSCSYFYGCHKNEQVCVLPYVTPNFFVFLQKNERKSIFSLMHHFDFLFFCCTFACFHHWSDWLTHVVFTNLMLIFVHKGCWIRLSPTCPLLNLPRPDRRVMTRTNCTIVQTTPFQSQTSFIYYLFIAELQNQNGCKHYNRDNKSLCVSGVHKSSVDGHLNSEHEHILCIM